jgi:hypothetical protein
VPLQFVFTLTFEDYLAAFQLNARKSSWAHFCLLFQEFVAPILGIVIGLYAILHALKGDTGVPFFVMLGISIYLVAWTNPRTRLKQRYRETCAGTEETWTFNEIQIHGRGKNWENRIAWSGLSSHLESDRILMLNLEPGRLIVIPKRICTDEQIVSLRKLIAEKLSTANGDRTSG